MTDFQTRIRPELPTRFAFKEEFKRLFGDHFGLDLSAEAEFLPRDGANSAAAIDCQLQNWLEEYATERLMALRPDKIALDHSMLSDLEKEIQEQLELHRQAGAGNFRAAPTLEQTRSLLEQSIKDTCAQLFGNAQELDLRKGKGR